MRIDKFLWCIRLYKTRTLAAEACANNRILVNDLEVKPSKEVAVGDIIKVRVMPAVHHYRIIQLTGNRLPAKRVPEFVEDITPEEEIEKQEMATLQAKMQRPRGAGRPTKRERRQIEKFFGDE